MTLDIKAAFKYIFILFLNPNFSLTSIELNILLMTS